MPPSDSSRGSVRRKVQRGVSNGACVEVASATGMVAIRGSKDPGGPVLMCTITEWDVFLERAKKGDFDSLCRVERVTVPTPRRPRVRPGREGAGRTEPQRGSVVRTSHNADPDLRGPARSRPQNQSSETGVLDFIDRLVFRAAKTDASLRRHLALFRFARSTAVAIVIAMLVGSLVLGAGVATAVTFAGLHTAVALGIGAGGSATFVLTVALRGRRYLKAVLGALSAIDRRDSANPL